MPCSPSALTVTHKIKYMGDGSIWHTFAETVQRLRKISESTKGQIKCLQSITLKTCITMVISEAAATLFSVYNDVDKWQCLFLLVLLARKVRKDA